MTQTPGAGEKRLRLLQAPLIPPPTPHWSQESIFSKQQFLIGWQSLVSQAVLNQVLQQEIPLQLRGPWCFRRGGLAVPPTPDLSGKLHGFLGLT